MFGRYDERKGDLRNASFLEVIIAVIIVLVILLQSNNIKFSEQEDLLRKQIKIISDENERLDSVIKKLEKDNRAQKREIEDLSRKIDLYKKYLDPKFADAVSENLVLEDKVALLEDQLAAAKKKLVAVGSGIDKPFCRLPVLDHSTRQNHKWLARVSWSDQGIEFKLDNALDEVKAKDIPGVGLLLEGSPLSNKQFQAAAELAFKHSVRQDIECRYNVIIEVDPKIDPPSSFIILVETYFYKGLRRSGRD
ncbi:hypothetical protein N9X41_04740 [Porticoccaceae bacterium]|nr:hypothetical protein [Porticoccaceae bacterium]